MMDQNQRPMAWTRIQRVLPATNSVEALELISMSKLQRLVLCAVEIT
jgi:hypothetical protein